MIDYASIEARWQKAWADARVFEAEPDDRKGVMIFGAEPYINAPLHIGHMRTFGTADLYARYMRMRGFNVLFPMALHATGTPVLAFAKRIRNNDSEIIGQLRGFGVSDEDIRRMSDPNYIVEYYKERVKPLMIKAGYGIDWRREFVSVDPLYSKMVEWQFLKLKEKGLLVTGSHPIGWCPNEGNAVGQHDTLHDVEPDIERISVIKFRDSASGVYFPCATYRPETVYGVTNIFIAPHASYEVVRIGGERYYLSSDAAEMLAHQTAAVREGKAEASELLGHTAINPVTNETVPILPGFFVRADAGTGVVMSVPAHAPFDYAALERLREEGYPMPHMEYKRVIEIAPDGGHAIGRSVAEVVAGEAEPLHPEIPALAYLEILHSDPHAMDHTLELATKLLYREESHWGRMLVGPYAGRSEPEAREAIKSEMLASGAAFEIYTLANSERVTCRCGTPVVVKLVDNQWFINYGDAQWKKKVRECFGSVRIYPHGMRKAFENASEWLDRRATERAQGLGTSFPFNREHIIEPLSDSTIYMAFFSFVHLLRDGGIKPEQLLPEFFDYVLNGAGSPEAVSSATGIDAMVVKRCRDSLQYWYSETSSHSAPDLVQNHLTMYLFNHVAVFDDLRLLPKQIVVNGMLNYEGQKMSKSLGNVLPLDAAIQKCGADPLRALLVCGAELDTESEYSTAGISSITARNEYLQGAIAGITDLKAGELRHIDYWLYSRLNSKIRDATAHMDKLEMRAAQTAIYFESVSELKKYFERGGASAIVVRDFLDAVVLMLAPSMPHVAEEFWHQLGNDSLAATERWPSCNTQMINPVAERAEELIDSTLADAFKTIELTAKMPHNKGKRLQQVIITLADGWKLEAYNMLADRTAIDEIMRSDRLRLVDRQRLADFVARAANQARVLKAERSMDVAYVLGAFGEARAYLEQRLNARLTIEQEHESKSPRAARAMPAKPSIELVWR